MSYVWLHIIGYAHRGSSGLRSRVWWGSLPSAPELKANFLHRTRRLRVHAGLNFPQDSDDLLFATSTPFDPFWSF